MPNHVINLITISGDRQKIDEMLSKIQNDEYGLGTVDFGKIIPMPEALNITSGSQTREGLSYYKSFVDVYTLTPEEVAYRGITMTLKAGQPSIAQGFPLELIGQFRSAVRPAVFVPQHINNLLHGHSLTDDIRLDLISQIGFHQFFTSIFS